MSSYISVGPSVPITSHHIKITHLITFTLAMGAETDFFKVETAPKEWVDISSTMKSAPIQPFHFIYNMYASCIEEHIHIWVKLPLKKPSTIERTQAGKLSQLNHPKTAEFLFLFVLWTLNCWEPDESLLLESQMILKQSPHTAWISYKHCSLPTSTLKQLLRNTLTIELSSIVCDVWQHADEFHSN